MSVIIFELIKFKRHFFKTLKLQLRNIDFYQVSPVFSQPAVDYTLQIQASGACL